MRSEIKVQKEKVYGRVDYRPVCETAAGFTKLLGQKLLTLKNLEAIKGIGFVVRVIGDAEEIL